MSRERDPPPPSYEQATGSSRTSKRTDTTHLQVPESTNGIPPAARRSMEDELRPLPPGWIRQFDEEEQHQFFVDTNCKPPRAIWIHPYDDETYLKSLTSEERERIQEEERKRMQSLEADKLSTHSAEDVKAPPRPSDKKDSTSPDTGVPPASGTPGDGPGKEKKTFGRKLKDKVTGTTHEERQAERARRAEQERQYYEAHQQFRRAMQRAQMTGQPQLLGKDKDGRDVYIEPPGGAYRGGYGGGYGGGYSGGAYGYNPYSSGPYADPNARFIRPQVPYGRPYGPGYGGGYGLPIAGGLLGGLLLGGVLGAGL